MVKLLKKVFAISMSAIMLLPVSSLAADSKYSDSYSKYAIVSDFDTGRVVYSKDADHKSAMASMSKIMTLLLTFDAIKDKKASPNDIVTIQPGDVNREGTNIKLVAGEKITLDELMKGMMIVSANDAALAIARHIGGDYSKFVSRMNSKAKEIGMKNTVFYNPNGLPYKISKDGVSTENTTTATDVLTLSKWIYKYYPSQTVAITAQKRFIDKKKGINEESTNPLLPILPNVDGLKTGYTTKAGYCLSYSMKVPKGNGNDASNRLMGVTMGSDSKNGRKEAAYSALTFIEKYYKTKYEYRSGQTVSTENVNGLANFKTNIITHKDVKVIKRNNEKFALKITYNTVSIGDIDSKPVGTATLIDANKATVTQFPVYLNSISKLSLLDKAKIWISAIGASVRKPVSNGKYPVVVL